MVREKGELTIVLGDMNAKSPLWKEGVQDTKVEYLTNWIAKLDLAVVNEWRVPTF